MSFTFIEGSDLFSVVQHESYVLRQLDGFAYALLLHSFLIKFDNVHRHR